MVMDQEIGINHALKPEYPTVLRDRASRIREELEKRAPKDVKEEDPQGIRLKLHELNEIMKAYETVEKEQKGENVKLFNAMKDLEVLETKIITSLHL